MEDKTPSTPNSVIEPHSDKRRSRPLTVWLILVPILNSMITIMFWYGSLYDYWTLVLVIYIALNVVFGYAAWKWRKWGVWGLGVMSVPAAFLGWLSETYFIVFPVVTVELVFLGILARRVWNQFKWR